MYVGTASPYNFNGLVRHYFLRRGANVADIQVNLVPKGERSAQSHDIAKRVRPAIQEIAAKYRRASKFLRLHPVRRFCKRWLPRSMAQITSGRLKSPARFEDIFDKTEGVVDVDSYIEDPQVKYHFAVDKEKAALNGVSAEQVAATLRIAIDGMNVGLTHQPQEKEDVPIVLRCRELSVRVLMT